MIHEFVRGPGESPGAPPRDSLERLSPGTVIRGEKRAHAKYTAWQQSCAYARSTSPLGRVIAMGSRNPQPDNSIRLRAFLALDNVELDIVALFQRFVSVQLNR